MKKIILAILFLMLNSCATSELYSSYTDYYSKESKKNNYSQVKGVDLKRKKLFKKYLEYSKTPTTSLISMEFLVLEPDLIGYVIYFIDTSDKSYTRASFMPFKSNNVIIEKRYFNDNLRHIHVNFLVRYVGENGINFKLDYLKNNKNYILDMEFGKTIITVFDQNFEVKKSRIFDSYIYLDLSPSNKRNFLGEI